MNRARTLGVERRRWARYGCAPAFVAAAMWATDALGETLVGVSPLFFAAVALSAWFGGLGPGLLATLLAGFGSAFFLFEPVYSLRVGWDDVVRISVFSLVAILIGLLQAAMRRTHAKLADATEQALAANRAKDQFLAVLSHELRNPLNPILTVAGVLASDSRLPEDVREDMRMIRRNAEMETRLVDDLLDLNRIARGKLALCFDTVDVHTLIEEVVGMCRADADVKGIEVASKFAAERHYVHGDAGRLRQVVWNLMRNAFKFTPRGGSVTVTTADESETGIRVEVTDTGIGIEPDALGRIFAAFEQGDTSTARRFGGLGLGLAIAKSLVESHQGTIVAASPGVGKGSTFTVRLPTAGPDAHPLPPLKESHPFPRLAGERLGVPPAEPMRVLLVQDHPDHSRALGRVLRAAGHTVTAVSTVGDAVRASRESSFDLLVSDVRLSDGSGQDVVRRIGRSDLRTIALGCVGSPKEWRESHDAGFEEYLSKPVSAQTLEAAIRRLIHDSTRRKLRWGIRGG